MAKFTIGYPPLSTQKISFKYPAFRGVSRAENRLLPIAKNPAIRGKNRYPASYATPPNTAEWRPSRHTTAQETAAESVKIR